MGASGAPTVVTSVRAEIAGGAVGGEVSMGAWDADSAGRSGATVELESQMADVDTGGAMGALGALSAMEALGAMRTLG